MNPIIRQDVAEILTHDLPWEELDGATVLITGGNGFLPAYMIECLAELVRRGFNIRIVAMVRSSLKGQARLGHLFDAGVQLLTHDVNQPLPHNVPAADFIIHAASQASPKYYGKDPVGTLKTNTLGTSYLLDHAVRSTSKGFLFFSSGEVYGRPLAGVTSVSEADFGFLDPTTVRACYGESKRLGETMCVAWAHQYGVPAVIVRPFHTYGPGMALDDGRVFADVVAAVVNKTDILLNSDGSALRPFCYAVDATLGVFTALMKGEVGQAYNIGNPEAEVSIRDLAYKVAGLFPERKIEVQINSVSTKSEYIKSPIQRSVPDISKLSRLGWRPKTSIEDGFRRTIQSFL